MKVIENVQTDLEVKAGQKAKLSELIVLCLDSVPQGGFTISEIRARARVQQAIESAANGRIELEDSDYAKARECVEKMAWPLRNLELEKLYQAFEL